MDGDRMITSIEDGKVTAYNRNGGPKIPPEWLQNILQSRTMPVTVDGELVGTTYFVFDLLRIGGKDATRFPCRKRISAAKRFVELVSHESIQFVPVLLEGKAEALEKLQAEGAEGAIFKDMDAPYESGRNRNFLKYKLIKDVDCVVIDRDRDGKNNLVLGMYDGRDYIEVGKCSALSADGPRAQIGDIVKITILYVTESGKLFHPVNPVLRTDKRQQDCTIDQLELYKTNRKFILNDPSC